MAHHVFFKCILWSGSAWVQLIEAFPLLLEKRPALKTVALFRCRGETCHLKALKWREGKYHLRSFMAILSSLIAGLRWFETSQPAKTSKLHQPTYRLFHQTQQKHMAVGQNRSEVPFWGWQSHLLCSSKILAGCSVSGLWPTPTYLSLVGKPQRKNNLSPHWKWRAKSSDALLSEAHLAGFVLLPRSAALSWLPLHKMNLAPSPLSLETAALCRDCRLLKLKALGSSWQHSASIKDLPTSSPMGPTGPTTRSKQNPWRSLLPSKTFPHQALWALQALRLEASKIHEDLWRGESFRWKSSWLKYHATRRSALTILHATRRAPWWKHTSLLGDNRNPLMSHLEAKDLHYPAFRCLLHTTNGVFPWKNAENAGWVAHFGNKMS